MRVNRLAAAVCAAVALLAVAGGSLPAEDERGVSTLRTIDVLPGRRIRCSTPQDFRQRSRPLGEIRLDTRPGEGALPIDCSANLFVRPGYPESCLPATRGWECCQLNWLPAELAYQPLYFDDVPLERYGQSVCPLIQPVISGTRFFAAFPAMPYKIGIDRTGDRVYTLGYYRVGTEAPRVRQRLPLELDASLLEAGTWVGLGLLLP